MVYLSFAYFSFSMQAGIGITVLLTVLTVLAKNLSTVSLTPVNSFFAV
jgi:hypothetical protein